MRSTAQTWDVRSWAEERAMSASAPAVVARADGTIVAANPQARGLMENGRLAPALQALVIDARLKSATVTAKMSLQAHGEAEGARRFDLVLLPLPSGDVLIIGREATLEANLTTALAASRELFRDLALCFNDFAFETDSAGLFTWASPDGVLGWSSGELHGARVRDIMGDVRPNPFLTQEAVKTLEVWVSTKAGQEACVSVTASPVLDAKGVWRGTRGVARNVTALKLQERAAAHARKRDELIAAVVNAVRAQVEPRRMMLAAADALAGATGSDFASIKALGTGLAVTVGACGEAFKLEATTNYQGKANGGVRLARDADAYGEAEESLFNAVLPHLGIALALAQSLETGTQSRTDPASGLLNRRGFADEAKRRLGAAARSARSTTLLVMDYDNLDELAKGRGDEAVLGAVGRSLLRVCGGRGLAGRVGGEKFALLLDVQPGDSELSEAVRSSIRDLREELRLREDVAVSIGAAVVEPETGENLEEMIGRAERAQRPIDHAGDKHLTPAPTVQGVTSC